MYNNTVNTGQDNSFRVIPRSYSPLLQARTWLGWRSDKKTTKTKKTNLKSKRVSERVRGFLQTLKAGTTKETVADIATSTFCVLRNQNTTSVRRARKQWRNGEANTVAGPRRRSEATRHQRTTREHPRNAL